MLWKAEDANFHDTFLVKADPEDNAACVSRYNQAVEGDAHRFKLASCWRITPHNDPGPVCHDARLPQLWARQVRYSRTDIADSCALTLNHAAVIALFFESFSIGHVSSFCKRCRCKPIVPMVLEPYRRTGMASGSAKDEILYALIQIFSALHHRPDLRGRITHHPEGAFDLLLSRRRKICAGQHFHQYGSRSKTIVMDYPMSGLPDPAILFSVPALAIVGERMS